MGLKSLWKRLMPVRPDTPAHVAGVKQGNRVGSYEKESGFTRDGRSTARRSTGVGPGRHNPTHPDAPNLSPP